MSLLAQTVVQGLLPPGAQTSHVVLFALAAALAAILCTVVKPLAIKADLVSRPRADRWARTVIPMGGGVAIMGALVAGLVAIALREPLDPLAAGWILGDRRFDLVIALMAVFVLGLVDDKIRLSPPVKLVVQTAAACFLVLRGTTLPVGPELLRAPVTVAWFVFMTNSVNLLDNMDGSAAGVSAVAASFVYVIAAGGKTDPTVAAEAAVLAGSALGFLAHNFPPASIFMGDAGSLVLGFALAALSARLPASESAGRTLSVAAPALILALPIFDTALVWVARRAARRPFFLGGRDHTTHRLVALGLSERQTVLVLYGAAFLLGGAALAVARGGLGTAVLVALGAAAGLLLVGVFLSDVRVYKEPAAKTPVAPAPLPATPVRAEETASAGGVAPAPLLRSEATATGVAGPNPILYVVELAVDVSVVSSAWVAAYVVKFADTGALEDYLSGTCLRALPFVIGLKVLAFLSQGLYRGVWRSIRFDDLFRILKACALGTVLVVAAAAVADRLKDYSREVFALDAVFTTGLIFLARSALRTLRRTVAYLAVEPRRAILLGPRALAPLVEQALVADGRPVYKLVGVVEPDATPAPGSVPPVLGGSIDATPGVAEFVGASVVLLALPDPGRAEVARSLAARGLEVVSVQAKLE